MEQTSESAKTKHTEVTALVGSSSLIEHDLEIFLKLHIPFHKLVREHSTKSNTHHMLPRI